MFKQLLLAGAAANLSLAAMAQAEDGDSESRQTAIIVTGEKIDRDLQDTPASVSVTTEEIIDESTIKDLRDIYSRTANVAQIGANGSFSIRGIDAFDVSGGGSSFLASVYVDGAVLPRRGVTNGPLDIWDVGQVEILRGPQSTLQGRNALAGAVIVRTNDPTYDFEAKGRVRVAEYDREEYSAAISGPVIEDELAVRLAAQVSEFGGYVENSFTGGDVDFRDRKSVRGKVLWEPAALPDLKALLTLVYDDHYHGTSLQLSETGPDKRSIALDEPTWESTETSIATLELDYALNEAWTLGSITSLNEVDYAYNYDGDNSAMPQSTVYDEENTKTLTQELRASFDYGRLTGLVGGYYYKSDLEVEYGGNRLLSLQALGVPQLLAAPPEFGGFGLPPALVSQVLAIYEPANPVDIDQTANNPSEITSMAAFADARYDVTDQLTIYGGLRFDREEQENDFSSAIVINNIDALPDPATYAPVDPMLAQLIAGINGQLFQLADQATGTAPTGSTEFDAVIPKLGATWNWTDDLSTSFTVQRGYRSGGVGANIVRASAFSFDPEYTWNYEFALRSQWLDGRLTANANAYYIDWTDQQVAVQLSGNQFDTETVNAGSSRIYGAEFETTYYPTDELSLFGGIGYTNTRFDDFTIQMDGTTTDLSGREFAGAPNWTGYIGGTYQNEDGAFVHVDANYQGSSNATVNPDVFGVDPENDARTLVNAMVGYKGPKYGLYFYVENLLDETYLVRPDYDDGLSTYGAPQVFGLRFDVAY